MPVPTTCPHCRYSINLPDHLRGQKVRCARCQKVFLAAPISKPMPVASRPDRPSSGGKAGVSHMTMILGMVVAFLLAVIVVGAGAFYFVMQNRHPAADTPVASKTDTPAPPTKETSPLPEKKLSSVTDDPRPVTKEPKEKEPTTVPVVSGSGDGSLSPEVLQRVKRSTVYLKVTLQDGAVSQGSGFLGIEPGTIITNAHVLQMMRASSPAPKQIDVILNSGQPDEQTFPGKLVGHDRNVDLAILKLAGDKFPEPLPVLNAKDLIETQQVFVCGFPLGQRLGKEITIGNSRVASLRRENGVLTRIQLSGEMNPGNSGGPIIDTKGNVIGVAVSGVISTTINFAIPGENVHALLNGRLEKANFGHPFLEGKETKVPATVRMLDPLQRVQKVTVEVWSGDPGDPRPGSQKPPVPQPNDSARLQSILTYQNGRGAGEAVLPPLPEGKVYWFQLVITGANGQSRWSPANSLQPAPPLERKAATLPTIKVGNQPLEVVSSLELGLDSGGGEDVLLALNFQAQLQEQVLSLDNQGTATIRLQYQRMAARLTRNGQPPPNNPFQQVASMVTLLSGDMRIDRKGTVLTNQADTSKVPPNPAGAKQILSNVGDQIQQLLQALTVPQPGGNVQVGQSWTAQRALPIDIQGRYDTCVIDCKYTYLGVRTREGKQEAVIELSGDVKPRPGSGASAAGTMRGTAIIDLASGLVSTVEATTDSDLTVPVSKGVFRAGGKLEMKLQRGP